MLKTINVMIAIACIALLGAQVFVSNRLVAQRFGVDFKERELRNLATNLATQSALLERSESVENLLALAQRKGMITSGNAQTLFVDTNVALVP